MSGAEKRAGGYLNAKVLLVEDNEVNRKVAGAMLARLGCTYKTATSGVEALAVLEKEHPDIVLMDIQMPVMDGLEATRRIRAKWGKNAPWIVAVTANAMTMHRDEAFEAGVDDYLAKPFRVDELRDCLAGALKQRQQVDPVTAPDISAALDMSVLDGLLDLEKRGEPGLVAGLVDLFFSETGDRMSSLRAALARGDARECSALSHSMKGSAGMLGARTFSLLCARVEKACKNGAVDEGREIFPEMERSFANLRTILESRGFTCPPPRESSSSTARVPA